MKETTEKLPTMIIERPKMPRSTWEALRAHIIRERLRKKQEQEQTQEVSLGGKHAPGLMLQNYLLL